MFFEILHELLYQLAYLHNAANVWKFSRVRVSCFSYLDMEDCVFNVSSSYVCIAREFWEGQDLQHATEL